jgi:hypothetical protein
MEGTLLTWFFWKKFRFFFNFYYKFCLDWLVKSLMQSKKLYDQFSENETLSCKVWFINFNANSYNELEGKYSSYTTDDTKNSLI